MVQPNNLKDFWRVWFRIFGAGVFVGFRGFWQIETETVPKRFLVRKVFGEVKGFWRLGVFGVFGLKYGKNASKSVVFGNSCN